MFKVLLKKEIVSLFCSVYSLVFALLFFITNGLILWYLQGSYNILDNGYATMNGFFRLSSLLFLLFIPVLTMRSFSDEIQSGTLNQQLARPVTISKLYLSKSLALITFLLIIILATFVYVYTIYTLSTIKENVDFGVIISSYIGLIVVTIIFVLWGVWASTLSKYNVLSCIVSLIIGFVLFYGFDLLGDAFSDIAIRMFFKQFSLNAYYIDLQRGIFSSKFVLISLLYIILAYVLALYSLGRYRFRERKRSYQFLSLVIIIGLLFVFLPTYNSDFTKDKRYTLGNSTKDILSKISSNKQPVRVTVYLADNINYSFQQLRNAVLTLLSDFNKVADNKLDVAFVDPTSLDVSSKEVPSFMSNRNMPPITLNEKNRDGKITQQLIYPYAEFISGTDTLQISFLKQLQGYTADENLNTSIENLEFEFIDALRLITNKEEQHIAFIEGHEELDRAYIYDAEEALSKYYFVNRGQIGNNLSVLNDFKVVIIAGSKQKFTEVEKYILDQYIMQGGRVLWLVDGTFVSESDLSQQGQSAVIKNESNFDDLLFWYGVRVNPDLLQDDYCLDIVLNNGENSQAVNAPWYYAPILIPSRGNLITDNIADVKSVFASSIDLLKTKDITQKILLTTAQNSRKIELPNVVDFDFQKIQESTHWFDDSFIPVAVSLEGQFTSAYQNRFIPDSLFSDYEYATIEKSVPTKMIVVSSSDIIRNELVGKDENTTVVPLGYDRLSGRNFGNKNFIVNAVNWLASDNDSILNIRTKKQNIALLDKQLVYKNRNSYTLINIALPIILVVIILFAVFMYRKNKFSK